MSGEQTCDQTLQMKKRGLNADSVKRATIYATKDNMLSAIELYDKHKVCLALGVQTDFKTEIVVKDGERVIGIRSIREGEK